MPAGKFAVTDIGNADVPIRSQDDRPAVPVQGDSRVRETTGLLLKSVILCWNFVVGRFTIQHWQEACHFPFDIFGPCLPIPFGEEKNANRAAGLLNQGRRAVAGLK